MTQPVVLARHSHVRRVTFSRMQFNWGVQELGLFLSFASVTRVFCLTVVLPVAIKLLHRPPAAIALPQDLEGPQGSMQLDDEGRPVVGSSSSYGTMGETMSEAASMEEELDDREKSIEELWTLRAKHLRLLHDSKFDVRKPSPALF